MQQQQQMPLTATADANGDASVYLPPLVGNSQIIVGIVNVETSGAACVAKVVMNDLPVCATPNGNLDTASEYPSITVTTKDTFGVVWSGCTPGDQCQAVFYYVNAPTEQGPVKRAQKPVSTWQDW